MFAPVTLHRERGRTYHIQEKGGVYGLENAS